MNCFDRHLTTILTTTTNLLTNLISPFTPRTEQPIINGPCQSRNVTQYDNATFKCTFQGYPTPRVQWFHDNREIKDAGKFIIETKASVSILDIAEADLDASGEYKFVVTNDHGKAECIATLKVDRDGKSDFEMKLRFPFQS